VASNDNAPQFLTANELVERWRGAISLGTLANWRAKKQGPGFNKFGTKVLYPAEEVAAYEAKHFQRPANDNGGGSK